MAYACRMARTPQRAAFVALALGGTCPLCACGSAGGASADTASAATTTASAAPPPAATPSAAPDGVDSPACAAYFAVVDCLGAKMPGAAGESMRKNAQKVREALGEQGAAAASACANAMSTTDDLARQYGCGDHPPAGASAPTTAPPGSSDPDEPSLTVGPDGIAVTGAELRGPPKACAAFHACCDAAMRSGGLHDELGLFCGLAQTGTKGDCDLARESVLGFLKEKGRKPPAGCE